MQDKNIAIIGASSGIGLAIVKQLIQEGCHVYSFSRNLSRELSDLNTTYTSLDVLSEDHSALSVLPSDLHGLVYCPGSINLKPFHRLTMAEFGQDMRINLYGAVEVIKEVLPKLKSPANASVVLFSTVAVQTGMPFHASVASAKGAVEGLTRALASEFAASKIRFNAIAPSLTQTPLVENLLSTPEKKENAAKRHPLGKYGMPDDIASMATFLLSDKSSWITGQIFAIDGGMSTLR